jgi:phage-related protein
VKVSLGYSLRRLQNGELPVCETRAMPSIGKGVWELKESDERAWYRVIYLSKIGSVIYVLHCFEKDSRKTDKRDVATARARLKRVRDRIQGEKDK